MPHIAAAGLLIVGWLVGCQAPQRSVGRNEQVALPDEAAYRQFWFHTIAAVRHFGYEMDRVDPAAGVITSKPLTSKQWFEFWRNDTLGLEQVLESSLQTIRRQVRVDVKTAPTNKHEYDVSVRVNVQRFSQTERQVTTSSSAGQAFSKLPPVRPAATPAEAGPHWVDLGRDSKLEQAILRRILLGQQETEKSSQ